MDNAKKIEERKKVLSEIAFNCKEAEAAIGKLERNRDISALDGLVGNLEYAIEQMRETVDNIDFDEEDEDERA